MPTGIYVSLGHKGQIVWSLILSNECKYKIR